MKPKGWWLVVLASIFAFLQGCGNAMTNNATEFDWYATESAPEYYPMEIIRGTFYYNGKNEGLYIPSGGTLYNGWGKSISQHIVGPEKKPLPDRLEINFFSYTEKQFYRGNFDLPYEKILSLFRQANIDRPGKPYYRSIMAGIAPGGAVSVWVNGAFTTEVFFGQAEKYDVLPFPTFGLPLDSKEESDEYISDILTNSLEPHELQALKKNGVPYGAWNKFRKTFNWMPLYTKGKEPTDKEMFVDYINGDKNKIPTHLSEHNTVPRALPKALQFSAEVNNESYLYIITFDEFELLEACEKLGAHGEKIYIEFDPQAPRKNLKIRIYNDVKPKDDKAPKEFIELKKFYVKP